MTRVQTLSFRSKQVLFGYMVPIIKNMEILFYTKFIDPIISKQELG